MNSVRVPTTASVKSETSRNGSQSSAKSKKGNSDLYRYNLDPDSDDELQRPREEARSSSSEKKKTQRRDRVYQHVQTQMADQQAARAAKNKRDKGDRENVELFIDRQRQAAVVLGERDLAGDVKAKRRRDRAKGDAEAIDATEYVTYLSQGIYEMKCGSAEVALTYLNRAVELEAEDEIPLVVRSECLNRLDRPHEALEDANRAMDLNPDNTRKDNGALISKAIALYNMGEFEASLIQFERGWRVRKIPSMKVGLMQCKDAILNTVGHNARGFDRELITKLIRAREREARKNQTKSADPRLSDPKSPAQLRREKQKTERMQERQDLVLLGRVAPDTKFLREFLVPRPQPLGRALSNEQRRALEIATDALHYLENRKTFWQATGSNS